ncbi:hypothetical protein HDU96_006367 [Phlyctochytrium bullatum]|nr:hypothetical protein HDU96_006367 [Phlyctochytrium bullatum]
MTPPLDLTLYLVTDRGLLPSTLTVEESVRAAIAGGATIVQLREKSLETSEFVSLARRLLPLCRAASVPLLINDRVDVALAANADGVHIGQDDIPLDDARKLLGASKIVGVTVESVEQALAVVRSGLADYVGTSAVFPTSTKVHPRGVKPLGVAGVAEILTAVRKEAPHFPVVTIGGISADNVTQLLSDVRTAANGESLDGVAVVSAIVASADPETASKSLRAAITASASIRPPAALPVAAPTSPSAALLARVAAAFGRVRATRPLVHNITNYVVMNDSANIILHLGASPLMAHSPSEMDALLAIDSSLVINIGTLSDPWIDGMHRAAAAANRNRKPVVMDPVGAGATPYRIETCTNLLTRHRFDVVKGNAGEIAALHKALGVTAAGSDGDAPVSRGVDSEGEFANAAAVAKSLALHLAALHPTSAEVGTGRAPVVAISGKVDHVSDGTLTVSCHNGDAMLGGITGTGCGTAALVGCFAPVLLPDDPPVVAAVGGILAMGIAAQKAVKSGRVKGPASFKVALFDEVAALTVEDFLSLGRITVA